MEAKEVPDRIFVAITHPVSNEYTEIIAFENGNGIEYIRTDTVIEKAREYFRNGLEDTKVMDDYRDILVPGIQAQYTSVEEFIEGFINYVKGDTVS